MGKLTCDSHLNNSLSFRFFRHDAPVHLDSGFRVVIQGLPRRERKGGDGNPTGGGW